MGDAWQPTLDCHDDDYDDDEAHAPGADAHAHAAAHDDDEDDGADVSGKKCLWSNVSGL